MTTKIFLLHELLHESEYAPVDPATVEVVNVGGRSYDRYAVRWIDKNGEVQATCGKWAFREDAQMWANQLKSLVMLSIMNTKSYGW